ncbi:MAG: hypothetical protein ACREVS_09555 [Burkholderiales bacterium]
MPLDIYRAVIPGWATSIELVADLHPEPTEPPVEFEVPQRASFLVGVVTAPDGTPSAWARQAARLSLAHNVAGGRRFGAEPLDTESEFVAGKDGPSLIVLNKPLPGTWSVSVPTGGPLAGGGAAITTPFAANVMVFHPAVAATPDTPPAPSVAPAALTFKCRACTTTAKALALAIVAAAALPALPQALIAAVGGSLGAGAAVAVAFISSVLGDTAKTIAEKLCKRVGLC